MLNRYWCIFILGNILINLDYAKIKINPIMTGLQTNKKLKTTNN